MESSESDFSSCNRPYEQSGDDFPISNRQKKHQSCASERYQSKSITQSSKGDFSSYKRPYERSDNDFPISKRQKRHQSCVHDR